MADAPVMGPRQNPGTRRSDLWPGADQHQYRIPEQGQPGMVNDYGLSAQLAGQQHAARDAQRRALQPGFRQGPQPPRTPQGAMQPGPGMNAWQALGAREHFIQPPGSIAPMNDGRTQLLQALMRLRLGGQPPTNQPRMGGWQGGLTNPNGVI